MWYLKINEVEEFLAIVALSLKASVYETRELIMSEDLTVIVKGMCARKLRIMVKTVFGVDCIIPTTTPASATSSRRCLTFVQTTSISRATIFEVCGPFRWRWSTSAAARATSRCAPRCGSTWNA